jgi:hypothetical protein
MFGLSFLQGAGQFPPLKLGFDRLLAQTKPTRDFGMWRELLVFTSLTFLMIQYAFTGQ